MIPVTPKPEPSDFESKVRKPGKDWLNKSSIPPNGPIPPKFGWKDYWTQSLEDLEDDYGYLCAYLVFYMEPGTGASSVDHFKPKHKYPYLAYEWSNFRLCSRTINGRKGILENIIDPFTMEEGVFLIDFTDGSVYHNPEKVTVKAQTEDTIKNLRLNDIRHKRTRLNHLSDCQKGKYSVEYLKQMSPFVHSEAVRQGML